MERVFKDSKPPSGPGSSLTISALRDDYAPGQFAIRQCRGGPASVSVKVNPLVHSSGAYSLTNVKANFVGFVSLGSATGGNEFRSASGNTYGTPADELDRMAPYECPDPITEDDSVTIRENVTQPVWLTAYVPRDAPAGDYQGSVEAITSDGFSAQLRITLKVEPVTLPAKRHLLVSNWFYHGNVAKHHGIQLWSEEFWKMLRAYARNMAEHRQNVVLTPLFDLVIFYRGESGRLELDYSLFDRWVETFTSETALERIEGSHLARWPVSPVGAWRDISPFDATPYTVHNRNGTIAYQQPSVKVGSEEHLHFLSQFLPSLEKHLGERDWLPIYLQHLCDEPGPPVAHNYRSLSTIVKQFAPRLRRIDAVQTTDLVNHIDVWVPLLQGFWKQEEYDAGRHREGLAVMEHHHLQEPGYASFWAERQRSGDEVWFYTCCEPAGRYPNRFLDYPLAKVRVLHWMNFRFRATGYLHWGFNQWPENPFTDVYHGLPPGDAFIVYPGRLGPVNSIRYEAMREGIEDYELLTMLSERPGGAEQAMEICSSVVRSPTDYARNSSQLREARQKVIAQLVET